MKRSRNILLFITAVLLTSCAKDSFNDQLLGPNDVQIHLALGEGESPRGDAENIDIPQDNYIHKLDIFIFKGGTKEKVLNFTVAQTSLDENTVWNRDKQTVTLRNLSDLSIPRTIYAVANLSANLASITTEAQLKDLLVESGQPLPMPTDGQGLVMSGTQTNYVFTAHDSKMVINLIRQVVKVKIQVKIDDALKVAYPLITFGDVAVRTLNVPQKSYLFGRSAVPPVATLIDIPARALSKTSAGWFTDMYLYENTVATGQMSEELATKFILSLPYSYTEGGTTKTTNNYYLVYINKGTIDSYKTFRNNLYDITVTVKGFGSDVPQIDGSEVETRVIPWRGMENPLDTQDIDLLLLTNTECQIYGDKDIPVLVGQATLTRTGIKGKFTVTKEASDADFELVEPIAPVDMEPNKPVDIKVKVLQNSDITKKHTLTLRFGSTTRTITFTAAFDKNQLLMTGYDKAYSDVLWCTLSLQDKVTQDQKQVLFSGIDKMIYMNTSKATLGNVLRIGTVMYTKGETVTRVMVVQQPFIDVPAVGANATPAKWATGNIGLGYRPDGQLCYVIVGASDYGLWFPQGGVRGVFNKNSLDGDTRPLLVWSSNQNSYLPSGEGALLLVAMINGVGWDTVYMNEAWPGHAEYKPLGDPCTKIYSASGIRWRKPTLAEAQNLINQKGGNGAAEQGWSNVGHLGQGFNTVDGKLFFPATGFRGNRNGEALEYDQEGVKRVQVLSWTSDARNALQIYPKGYAETGSDSNGGCRLASIPDYAALPVRCVRVN